MFLLLDGYWKFCSSFFFFFGDLKNGIHYILIRSLK